MHGESCEGFHRHARPRRNAPRKPDHGSPLAADPAGTRLSRPDRSPMASHREMRPARGPPRDEERRFDPSLSCASPSSPHDRRAHRNGPVCRSGSRLTHAEIRGTGESTRRVAERGPARFGDGFPKEGAGHPTIGDRLPRPAHSSPRRLAGRCPESPSRHQESPTRREGRAPTARRLEDSHRALWILPRCRAGQRSTARIETESSLALAWRALPLRSASSPRQFGRVRGNLVRRGRLHCDVRGHRVRDGDLVDAHSRRCRHAWEQPSWILPAG